MAFVKGLRGKVQGNICKREGSRSFCFGLGDISEHSVYASWTELSFADDPLCPPACPNVQTMPACIVPWGRLVRWGNQDILLERLSWDCGFPGLP